jgi:hypothetical protein
MVFIHNAMLLSHKKNEILSFIGKCMELENIILRSHPGSENQKLHVLPHMHIVDLKQMQQYHGTGVTLRGGSAREELGKGRKPKT